MVVANRVCTTDCSSTSPIISCCLASAGIGVPAVATMAVVA